MLRIRHDLVIDEDELEYRATTSQGPGGQHVNRSQTRVVLRFDVRNSPSLSEEQREKILERLSTRINRDGVLQVASQRERSQQQNREAARERFVELIADALHEDRRRRATKPTRASRKRRVDDKKQRGSVKKMRRKPKVED